jgi:glutamine amidotransferase
MSGVAIVDNGGANIASLRFALARLGVDSRLTSDPHELSRADRVILPGVGTAADAMSRLRALGLESTIRSLEQPVLGICLGMQILFEASEEGSPATGTECLGVVPDRVRRMTARRDLPVPHMGWNRLRIVRDSPLLEGIADGEYFYFVHGYSAPPGPWTLATTNHGSDFAAAIRLRNFYGTQFHPERSAAAGSRLLANFLRLQ